MIWAALIWACSFLAIPRNTSYFLLCFVCKCVYDDDDVSAYFGDTTNRVGVKHINANTVCGVGFHIKEESEAGTLEIGARHRHTKKQTQYFFRCWIIRRCVWCLSLKIMHFIEPFICGY